MGASMSAMNARSPLMLRPPWSVRRSKGAPARTPGGPPCRVFYSSWSATDFRSSAAASS